MMKRLSVLAAVCLVAAPLCAQSDLRGPLLTLQFEPDKGVLRPVWGMPGAAWTGPALELGFGIARVAVAARQGYAIAEVAGEERMVVIGFATGTPEVRDLAGVKGGEIVISPEGTFAAVFAAGRVQVLKGLPDAAGIDYEVQVDQPFSAFAVSDHGRVLYGNPAGVFAITRYGVRYLMAVPQPAAIAFFHRSEQALVTDMEANQVYRTNAGNWGPLAGEAEGIHRPGALAISADNRRAYIAMSDPNTVAVVELQSGSVTVLPAPVAAEGMDAVTGSAVYRITGWSRSPMWILDGEGEQARFLFVAPASEAVDGVKTGGAQ